MDIAHFMNNRLFEVLQYSPPEDWEYQWALGKQKIFLRDSAVDLIFVKYSIIYRLTHYLNIQ